MKASSLPLRAVWVTVLLLAATARAFPPAPDGVIYGLVKDQYGTPLINPADQVILQTPGGVQVATQIQPGLAIGVNYVLHVPMDAATTSVPYAPSALITTTPYKLWVVAGAGTNLPIEMAGPYAALGKPSQVTQQDLTLGADVNGDGIPDAWEAAFFQGLGTNVSLSTINPNADYAHDGRTLRQEYLLGNYPYNPGDNFQVRLVSQHAGSAVLAFTTMTGRTYTAQGSADLQSWAPLSFTVPTTGTSALSSYYAGTIQPLQIQTVQPANGPQMQFFRLELQ